MTRNPADAESSGAILFLDEADALFGKRTEVKDSHDRYANTEIDHVLQRMEEHPGPVVLATNMKPHLDHAFLRRPRTPPSRRCYDGKRESFSTQVSGEACTC